MSAMFNLQLADREDGASARYVPWLGTLILAFLCLIASTCQSWAADYDVDLALRFEVPGTQAHLGVDLIKDVAPTSMRWD